MLKKKLRGKSKFLRKMNELFLNLFTQSGYSICISRTSRTGTADQVRGREGHVRS